MECGALVSEAFLAGAESAEVLSGARHNVGAKCHLNAAQRIAVGGHVEENNGVRHNWNVKVCGQETWGSESFGT